MPARIFICNFCDNSFTRKNPYTKPTPKFCSIKCSSLSRVKPREKRCCEYCKNSFEWIKNKRNQGRFCSRYCRSHYLAPFFSKMYKGKFLGKKIKKKRGICWTCNKTYLYYPSQHNTRYCSQVCAENRWSRSFPNCKKCHKKDLPHEGYGYCKKCYYTSPEGSARQRDKNGRRRARKKQNGVGRVGQQWINELKTKTTHCPLCNKKMENHGRYPDGKHLDHIIPITAGGPHCKENLRYICAECNDNRPYDGSDLKTQNLPKKFIDFFDLSSFSTRGGVPLLTDKLP